MLPDNKVYIDAVWGSDTVSLRRYRRAFKVVYRLRYDSLRRAPPSHLNSPIGQLQSWPIGLFYTGNLCCPGTG